MGTGVAIYMTELWRDPEGRGSILQGAIDGPQIAAVMLVLAGALVLRERKHANARFRRRFRMRFPARRPAREREAAREFLDARSMCPSRRAGQRLDQFLAAQLEGVSRSRVQLLIEQGDVLVEGEREKPSLKLRAGERIVITGEPHPAPLKAMPEAIPLDVVYEDADLAVVNKPAGMMVHAGSGQTDDLRSRGTLVNALLHRFNTLSSTGGELRPGIVHRLDKSTSGLIVVAKNDRAHAALGAMFSGRRIQKTYMALVHGAVREKRAPSTPR